MKVSPIGLGLAALGRPGYINLGHGEDLKHEYDIDLMQAKTNRVLNAALKHGIRYFDAARSYGLAEAFLSYWLKLHDLAPHDVAIGSKWGYTYTAGWQVSALRHEVKEHSLPNLKKQWLESKGLLGHHLDLYQIHSATLETGVLDNDAVLEKLAEIKADGHLIGLSLSGTNQADTLARALEVTVQGERLFDTVQATFNVLETSASRMLEEAHKEGLGIIIKETLANGRLTERNTAGSFAGTLDALRRLGWRYGVGIDAIALSYVLCQPWVDVALSGAATVEQLNANVEALDVALDEEALDVLAGLTESAETYWQIRSDLSWN